MNIEEQPSIINQFSKFSILGLVCFVFVVILLCSYWTSVLIVEKKDLWGASVETQVSPSLKKGLDEASREIKKVARNARLSVYIDGNQHSYGDLIYSEIVRILSSSANQSTALKAIYLVDEMDSVIAKSEQGIFYKDRLEKQEEGNQVKSPLIDGVFKDSKSGEIFAAIRNPISSISSTNKYSIIGFVSIDNIVNKSVANQGDGDFIWWNGVSLIPSRKLGAHALNNAGLKDELLNGSSLFKHGNNYWLASSVSDQNYIVVEIDNPNFGYADYALRHISILILLGIFSFLYIKVEQRLRHRFQKTISNLANSSTKALLDPSTFDFHEGAVISATYKEIIDAQAMSIRELEHLAYKDPLTGFLNNRSFMIEVDKLVNKKDTEFILLSIEVNHFDRIATAHGAPIANQMLVYLSEKIHDFLELQKIEPFDSKSDSGYILGLLSAQKFGIVFNSKNRSVDERYLAQNIISMTKRTIRINNNEVFITTNVGTSHFPYDAQNCNDLVQRSKIALEKSLQISEGSYCIYSGEFQGDLVRLETLQSDMHRAQKRNEFRLEYQPIFNEKQVTIGVEALVRWNHPSFGNISPDEFISIAEGNGFIVDIGYWVLIHACQQIGQWKSNGFRKMVMSINVSGKQLLDIDFASKVFHAIEVAGATPGDISLEITETTAMNIDDTIQKNIASIKEYGVKISMDDFGTGHSSLSRLVDMKVDTIKIDRSFVQDIESNETKLKLVKSICEMSKALELDVICEGVENLSQLSILKGLGIRKFQGFVYSKPLSGLKIEERLRTQGSNVISIDMRKH